MNKNIDTLEKIENEVDDYDGVEDKDKKELLRNISSSIKTLLQMKDQQFEIMNRPLVQRKRKMERQENTWKDKKRQKLNNAEFAHQEGKNLESDFDSGVEYNPSSDDGTIVYVRP